MSEEKLKSTSDGLLFEYYERAIVLETKDSGNGKSPFDKKQIKEEILRRLKKLASPSSVSL